MMKHRGLFLALFISWAIAVHAQVEVEVITDQSQFLPGESLPVKVRIFNRSGQTLHFGAEDWLNYSIESRGGGIVEKTGDAPMGHDFDVPTSKVATQSSDLAPYFRISKSGHYFITATVKLKDWAAEATSRAKSIEVLQGVKMWEQPFGVPSADTHEQPETRKYILQKATYLKNLKLYLRVTDISEDNVFRVLPVGSITSFSKLQTLLDGTNNLHLLYEEGARTYNYTVANVDGDLLLRQSYYTSDTNPRLKLDKGNVSVVGGFRRAAATDFPPSERELPAIPAKPPATPAITKTNAPATKGKGPTTQPPAPAMPAKK